MESEFNTHAKPELCRMVVKIWLSGSDPELEAQFLAQSLIHLISGQMSESPLIRYTLTPDNIEHVEYPDKE